VCVIRLNYRHALQLDAADGQDGKGQQQLHALLALVPS
jgi:hypothetical protein